MATNYHVGFQNPEKVSFLVDLELMLPVLDRFEIWKLVILVANFMEHMTIISPQSPQPMKILPWKTLGPTFFNLRARILENLPRLILFLT